MCDELATTAIVTTTSPGPVYSCQESGNERRDGRAQRVNGARQRSGGVEKYSSIASWQAPEHGSTAISPGPDSRISAAVFSAQLVQTPARSIPQPVQLQLDL